MMKQFSKEQTDALSKYFDTINHVKKYQFPWSILLDDLKKKGINKLKFVGYGSILNSISASQSFKELPYEKFKAVLVFGVKRVFNYQIPDGVSRYGKSESTIFRAALNTQFTGNVEDAINGVLFELPLDQISNLRQREPGYDLLPVVCKDWDEINSDFFTSYILSCPDEKRNGKIHTNYNLLPNPKYYNVCKEGAKSKGEEFLNFWLNSTYLADGDTLVKQWEIENKELLVN